MFDGLYFEYPKAISFIVIYIACEAYCKIRSRAIYFPHVKQLTKETVQLSTLMWFLKWSGILFLLLAIMSPVRDEQLALEPKKGPDTVFVLQTDKQMQMKGFSNQDLNKTRLENTKIWIRRWIEQHPYSRYGIVVASRESYIASPLSASTKAVKTIVRGLQVSHFSGKVDYSKALQQTQRVLTYGHTKSKLVVIVGDEDVTSLKQNQLKVDGVRLYRIAIVENDITIAEEDNQSIESDKMYRVSTLEQLDNVAQDVDHREKLTVEQYTYTFKVYYYFYPLFLAFFILLIYVYLRNRRGHA